LNALELGNTFGKYIELINYYNMDLNLYNIG